MFIVLLCVLCPLLSRVLCAEVCSSVICYFVDVCYVLRFIAVKLLQGTRTFGVKINKSDILFSDRLYGAVVRVLGYRPGGPVFCFRRYRNF
jgi:hypothetical protein